MTTLIRPRPTQTFVKPLELKSQALPHSKKKLPSFVRTTKIEYNYENETVRLGVEFLYEEGLKKGEVEEAKEFIFFLDADGKLKTGKKFWNYQENTDTLVSPKIYAILAPIAAAALRSIIKKNKERRQKKNNELLRASAEAQERRELNLPPPLPPQPPKQISLF